MVKQRSTSLLPSDGGENHPRMQSLSNIRMKYMEKNHAEDR